MTKARFRIFPLAGKSVNWKTLIVDFSSVFLTFSLIFSSFAYADDDFKRWISEFRIVALAHDISPSTFDAAFENVDTIDPEVLKRAAYQPEFVDPSWSYFDNRVHDIAVAEGQRQAQIWNEWLPKIEKHFGVNRNILLAIWSIESNYGKVLANKNVVRDTIRSLATLAYADPKRGEFARTQLIAAMKILQSGEIHRSQLTGSWAGALGHTQFIPSSYLSYAVDIDGDGRRDIWTSIPDALATAANLLHMNGWQPDLPWGIEVKLPRGKKFPDGWLPLEQWTKLGVQRAHTKPFLSSSESTMLKLPDGSEGPAFLVTKNFFVIKRYNNADRYALAVALLADRISGHPGLRQDWNRPFEPITFRERMELQSLLAALGDYKGDIDGKIGTASKQAIRTFQQRQGLEATGYPSRNVLLLLRKQQLE